ncbi:MAG TPA: DUF1801 domain-containing protein [Candidatus Acidoferrales bacterium]|jgi:uncharacterized protein YdhG (YjbR/CyaY superfamily)|nr:DUF1801 domain-containing protein [Candidatus Acidoferrales bacterium]
MRKTARDVDAYIAAAPKEARAQLRQLRKIIKATAPAADEGISYRMPYYRFYGALAGFAAFQNHISLFGGLSEEHQQWFRRYETAKGTIRFPLGMRLPGALIRKLIKARMRRNEARRKR